MRFVFDCGLNLHFNKLNEDLFGVSQILYIFNKQQKNNPIKSFNYIKMYEFRCTVCKVFTKTKKEWNWNR